MKKLKKNLKLNWPSSLSEITLKNISTTEVWFLREMLEGGNFKRTQVGTEVRDPKFGYNECFLDIEDQRYLVKYKQWANGMRPAPEYENVIFYLQKFKRLTK